MKQMRVSNVWFTVSRAGESNGSLGTERLSHSLPGSPADRRPNFPEVVGSAESLVGRVSVEWFCATCIIYHSCIEYYFLTKTLLLTGTGGARSWQILWCRFRSLHISWDAGSVRHDSGGDGPCGTSALAAGTSRKTFVLPDVRSGCRGGDWDGRWTWIRWYWSSLIAARPAWTRAFPTEFHCLSLSLHYQVPHILLQGRLKLNVPSVSQTCPIFTICGLFVLVNESPVDVKRLELLPKKWFFLFVKCLFYVKGIQGMETNGKILQHISCAKAQLWKYLLIWKEICLLIWNV